MAIPSDHRLAVPPRVEARTWLARRPDVPECWFRHVSRVHGVTHTQRVHIHAQRLIDRLGWSEAEGELALTAALWHDIGRHGDGVEPEHGARSVAAGGRAPPRRPPRAGGRRSGAVRDPAALPAGPGRGRAGGHTDARRRRGAPFERTRSAPFASCGCSRMRTPWTASAWASGSAPTRASSATLRPSISSRSPARCTPCWPDRGGRRRTRRRSRPPDRRGARERPPSSPSPAGLRAC